VSTQADFAGGQGAATVPSVHDNHEKNGSSGSQRGIFDNMSNISAALGKIEMDHIAPGSLDPITDRNAALGTLGPYLHQRSQLGRVLWAYRQHFKPGRGWVAAATVIADPMGREVRTVFRIVEDYERAMGLPPMVFEAMVEQKLDPAEGKNAPVVEKLLQMPKPETRSEAVAAVTAAVREHVAQKKEKRKASAKVTRREGEEHFAKRIVKEFEDRYRSVSPQQRDSEVRSVLERVASALQADIHELRPHSLPGPLPKTATAEAA
jgi:hypothetical protein